jgi:gliding motility-associated-like protein
LGSYESYGYNVGTLINNLNHYSAIGNTLNTSGVTDTFTCTKTPVRLFVKVGYPATSITWKLSQVASMSPNVDSIITNPVPIRTEIINGRTYYVYSLQQDFIFNQPGTYTIPITYTADEVENCSRTEYAEVKIVVRPGPVADFTYSSNNCINEQVRFTGITSSGAFTINGHSWLFSDNSTASTISTIKSFPSVGNQAIRYSVVASNGCVGDTIKQVPIGIKPVVDFSIINNKPCVDSVFGFASTATVAGGATASWYWNFGDAQTYSSTTENAAQHTYGTAATNVLVKHWITATGGCNSDTIVKTIPAVYANPIANFTAQATAFCTSMPIQLSSTLTGIANWNWNFGNGTGNQAPPFTHLYLQPGTFTISLQVTDVHGCASRPFSSSGFAVAPAPDLNAGPDKNIVTGGSAQFAASITNPSQYTFLWTPSAFLSDPTLLNPVASPTATTQYIIKATHTTSGCEAKDTVQVGVYTGLYIPNAFTPNGDGKNDKWEIPGLAMYPDAEVLVFDRGGQIIYRNKGDYTNNYWDGKYKGKRLPAAVYVYTIKLASPPQILKGVLALIY